jgi:hypothetical protein
LMEELSDGRIVELSSPPKKVSRIDSSHSNESGSPTIH